MGKVAQLTLRVQSPAIGHIVRGDPAGVIYPGAHQPEVEAASHREWSVMEGGSAVAQFAVSLTPTVGLVGRGDTAAIAEASADVPEEEPTGHRDWNVAVEVAAVAQRADEVTAPAVRLVGCGHPTAVGLAPADGSETPGWLQRSR